MLHMLHWLDWLIIGSFLLLSLGIGMYFRKNAGRSIADFFLGGRNLPWYVAGISMVATTFAADTPLAVSELVAQGGIAKNWLWWSYIMGGALTTFFFATLWRRSGVLTELEFITLRYEGKAAHYLRMVKSVYLGLILNAVIIAWVNLAMATLLEVFFDLSHTEALWYTMGMMVLAVIYSTLSGLKGVAVTDVVQFVIAMIGCVTLAVLVVNSDQVGGITAMKSRLPDGATDFVPSIGGSATTMNGFGLTIGAFLSFVAIQWWSSWYPGSEPGGGGYIAQRMMSTRSEKESVWATLLFQVGHYCVRPWPWIVVGLCAIVLYSPALNDPELETQLQYFSQPHAVLQTQPEVVVDSILVTGAEKSEHFLALFPSYVGTDRQELVAYHYSPKLGFVYAMRDFLPVGLVGLLLVAFIAAYLSTISTQVNWGASYLVNDLIRPMKPEWSEQRLVFSSRIASIAVMVAGAMITPFITSISAVWAFIMQCGAGLGLVLILRWYWWRINAWSEIAATIAPLVAYAGCHFYLNETLGTSFVAHYGPFYVTVGFTTFVWLMVTFASKAPSRNLIERFEKRVRPMGVWPAYLPHVRERNKGLKWMFGGWISMTATIIFSLFGIGSLVLLNTTNAIINIGLAITSVFALRMFLKKTNIFDRNSDSA